MECGVLFNVAEGINRCVGRNPGEATLISISKKQLELGAQSWTCGVASFGSVAGLWGDFIPFFKEF